MARNFTDVMKDFNKLYAGLTNTNKAVIGGILTVVVASFIYLIGFADVSDYDYLYTNIEDADAGAIIDVLKEQGVKFKLENKSIMVPQEKVYELRMSLASKGLPHSEGIGFEIFDDQKLGTSSFVQTLNLNRALQGELSRTIGQLDKIKLARVHLVVPKKALFTEDQVEPTASVVLKMKPGKELSPKEVKSVVHLVASSVAGLDSNAITIIDSNGRLLSKAIDGEEQFWGSSPLDYKNRIERDLGVRVEEMVAHVVGVGKVVSKVTVELDFKKEEKTEEIFDPDQVVVRSEKIVKENRNNSAVGPSGLPGTQSNTAKGPNSGRGNQNTNSDRERNLINYEINKVIRHTTRAAGDIKKLSVAVLVDGTYTMEDIDGEMVEKYHPRAIDEIKKIREMVKRAVGFDTARGDMIEVTNVPFETSVLDAEELQQSFLEKYDFLPQLMKYGIVIALAMIMIFFIFRPLVEWVISFHEEERLRELESEQEDVVKNMEDQLVEVRRTIESSTSEYKKRLSELADQAPELVTAILRNWIELEE